MLCLFRKDVRNNGVMVSEYALPSGSPQGVARLRNAERKKEGVV